MLPGVRMLLVPLGLLGSRFHRLVRKKSGEIRHVLITQARRDRSHRWMLALTRFVRTQRAHDVGSMLPVDLGHAVDRGERGLVAGYAVAARAHGALRASCIGITLILRRCGQRKSDADRGADE